MWWLWTLYSMGALVTFRFAVLRQQDRADVAWRDYLEKEPSRQERLAKLQETDSYEYFKAVMRMTEGGTYVPSGKWHGDLGWFIAIVIAATWPLQALWLILFPRGVKSKFAKELEQKRRAEAEELEQEKLLAELRAVSESMGLPVLSSWED
jgi:hypothetical protein